MKPYKKGKRPNPKMDKKEVGFVTHK